MKFIAAAILLFATIAVVRAEPIPAFSGMTPGAPVSAWSALKPAPNAPDTRYTLVRENGVTVLQADAERSMSGLVFSTRVAIAATPLLRWRWKITAPIKAADMTKKSGDDYAARIYVLFDYPVEKLSFATRAKLRLGEALYRQKIPTAALNYVWDNRQPIGTMMANAYTDRARMVVVESGGAKAGQWITETRDVGADFKAAFGEDAPDVIGVAVATDTDNTGEHAVSWYGDLEFIAR